MRFFFADKAKKEKKPASVNTKEVGTSGVQFFSGLIQSEEYINDLRGTKGIAVFDRMRKSDGQVKGICLACTLPIIQTKWFIEPASEDSQDVEIADAVSKNLFEGMSITWNNFLKQALTHLFFGFSIFEKVFEFKDGLYQYRKLAPRLQRTVSKWFQDEHGGFNGFEQYTQMPDGRFVYLPIPREKCLLFVNDQEGSNFEGQSILRPAYKHWYIKDQLYTIDALGHDRFSAGVPWAKEAENASDADRNNVSEILQQLYSREKSYMRVPYGWELGIFEKTNSNQSLIASIKHHNEEIAKAILAQFINLGTTETGSRSLGDSFVELFLMSLNSVADNIAETMNRYCIKDMVDYNWNVSEYPKLKFRRIMFDVYAFLNQIGNAVKNGILTTDFDIENSVRNIFGFSEKDEETYKADKLEKIEQQQQAFAKVGNQDEKNQSKKEENKNGNEEKKVPKDRQMSDEISGKLFREYKRRRQLTELEKEVADFDAIQYTLDESVNRFENIIKKVRTAQAKEVAREVVMKSPDNIKVPFVGKLADRLYDEMLRVMNKGKLHVREEIQQQKNQADRSKMFAEKTDLQNSYDEEEVKEWLKSKSKADAVRLGNNLTNSALFNLYHIDTKEKSKDQTINELTAILLAVGIKEIAQVADSETNAAYGYGREIEAQDWRDDIKEAVYSAILDDHCCEVCLPKDGVSHALDDERFRAPNSDECLGKDHCRCINIYVFRGNEKQFVTKTITEYKQEIEKTSLEKEKAKYA